MILGNNISGPPAQIDSENVIMLWSRLKWSIGGIRFWSLLQRSGF